MSRSTREAPGRRRRRCRRVKDVGGAAVSDEGAEIDDGGWTEVLDKSQAGGYEEEGGVEASSGAEKAGCGGGERRPLLAVSVIRGSSVMRSSLPSSVVIRPAREELAMSVSEWSGNCSPMFLHSSLGFPFFLFRAYAGSDKGALRRVNCQRRRRGLEERNKSGRSRKLARLLRSGTSNRCEAKCEAKRGSGNGKLNLQILKFTTRNGKRGGTRVTEGQMGAGNMRGGAWDGT